MESFFSSLNEEYIKKVIYRNREIATADIYEFIDMFFNQTRWQSHFTGVFPTTFRLFERKRLSIKSWEVHLPFLRGLSDMSTKEREDIFKRLGDLSPWHFDHEILPGVRTGSFNRPDYADADFRGVALLDPGHMTKFFQKCAPGGICGKSLLDVACNSGAYCFLAHVFGAKRVLGVDVRQHWIDQAEFVRAIKFPRSTDIEFRRMDIAGYLNLSEERFDITIFKGIFYHLPDPIGVLGRLCDLTKETILVDTDSSDAVPESCLTAIKESKTQVMSGVDGLAWLPGGPAAIRPILEFKGFEFTEVKYWHRQTSPNKRGRFSIVGSRSPITM